MSQTSKEEEYSIISKIGCGFSADVQLVSRSGELMALKVYKAKQDQLYENEIRIMNKLSHISGVIRIRESELRGCIMMDYAKYGNLLQYLQQSRLEESIARSFFKQMIFIIDKIHKMGVAHRDLKLENILLDDQYKLKICDFGFAVQYLDEQGRRIKVNDYVGTPQTAAPEIYLRQPYHPVEADLFQLGVILFQICAGSSPFHNANIKSDPNYQLIYRQQIGKFWEKHQFEFSAQLKDIIVKLLAFNPNRRLSIPEIQSHPWMQGEEADQSQIIDEMECRQSILSLQI
ncbi:unnamed protein product (macronuclear) [Paramecium tetraurelia]|uniref:non-specific serine/threonine protein kinase n=1 Tax=Paramecium tetraurelia TaxID=5888 RepID=A0CYA2_PARTE|nr:uncharacterized protein GSPATT00011369001 [Paramecium tetraurelia]CAK75769.1 unnamed protein product [Paramecium tetraurelia]|eukprot:XP_001443166.1 hypothetical protein (macronuclear) [Paramecium tetraurelia strain d4-2]